MTLPSGGPCQHQLFEAQVRRDPDATAAVCDGAALSYRELDERASRLAHHLQRRGVGAEVLVGVCLEPGLDLAVALLAVLKAGGACVPLDPTYPPERLAFMVADAGLDTVVTSSRLIQRLPAPASRLVQVGADGGAWSACPSTGPSTDVGPSSVSYVIYTSGSTGQPKGVLLTHRGLVNHHLVAVDLYALGPGDRVVQFCSIGFDASIEEMFPTWAAGATVVFRSRDVPILGRAWLQWLRDERITVLNLPTGYWHEWVRDLERSGETVPDDVRLVIVGGEKAQGTAYRAWLRVGGDRPRWVNAYGPTEATCMTTVFEPGRGDDLGDGDPPIGRPLPNTTAVVVDERGGPVAPGGTGELLIGGVGLARGYLNHPRLTAERFVDDGEGNRLYRTGDLVRRLPSGDLEYVGRLDAQVKIQGFRVECGEVEAALSQHPSVSEAVVVPRDSPSGKRLVAYLAQRQPAVGGAQLRSFLTDRLPSHMVPTAFVAVDAFPLTANGKVDRDALPAPPGVGLDADRPRAAPATGAEERMLAIWADVFQVDAGDLSVHDDFFELGGHSLLATHVIARVREEFGTDTPLRAIFEAPTVASLAALVATERVSGTKVPPLVPRARSASPRVPLSVAQEQMWDLELAADPPGLYNVTAMHRLARPVDEDALRRALAFMVERHETLRTSFVVEGGRPVQVVASTATVGLRVVDLAGCEPDEVRRQIGDQDRAPFQLDRPPLLRAGLFHLDAASSQLAVTFDHLISDATSAEVFMAELAESYACLGRGAVPDLPPLPVQFADFALWQRQWLTEEVCQAQLEWWRTALDGMPLGPAIDFDHVPTAPTRRIASRPLDVPPATYRSLQQLARATSGSVFIVCVAAVEAVLSRMGGKTDIVLSTTLSGRSRVELEGLISMFAGVGRIRTDVSGDPSFTELIGRARASVLGLFEHQDVPFMRVRRALLPEFPADGLGVASAVPVELAYFRAPATEGAAELFFRGQLHPLSVTLHDDGERLRGQISYKTDFYDERTILRLERGIMAVLGSAPGNPARRLSELPIPADPGRMRGPTH